MQPFGNAYFGCVEQSRVKGERNERNGGKKITIAFILFWLFNYSRYAVAFVDNLHHKEAALVGYCRYSLYSCMHAGEK